MVGEVYSSLASSGLERSRELSFEQLMLDLFIPGSSGTRKCCKPRAIASTYSLTSQPTRASPSGSRGLHLLGKQSRQELTMREDKWPSEKE